jgi:hypothetical protein
MTIGSRRRSRTTRTRIALAVAGVLLAGATALAGGALAETNQTALPAAPDGPPQPGTFNGLGFDACTAPSSPAMQAWLASPYRAVGIYFGGVNRYCAQPNLTQQWVADQIAAGWHLFPLYVGPQAPCYNSTKPKIDPAQAAAQGQAAADDAAVQAENLGLARDSVLIYDMEAYAVGDTACTAVVNTFMNSWTTRLHDHGYLSGFYSSMSSGVADQVAAYATAGYAHPDYLDFAKWDGVKTVSDPAVPADYWAPKRRMKQYQGDHNETWGGVTINIDSNYLDLAPLPTTPFADFTGNGWADLAARKTSTGEVYAYPGNGTRFGSRFTVGSGWNASDLMLRLGDFDRSGGEDIVARETATGYLWLYPGTGTGVASRVKIGSGWSGMRELTPIGDHNRDGYQDMLAVKSSTGALYLYPGRGDSFGTRVLIASSGWNNMDELTGGADFNGDGYPDLVAREKSTGYLYLYPGRSGGFGTRTKIGSGWNSMRDLVLLGDFDRDGRPDLVAIQKSTGYLMHYRWNGSTGWRSALRMGTGWSGMQPLL